MYGEDDGNGTPKEDLFYTLQEFLENHSIAELLKILSDVVDE